MKNILKTIKVFLDKKTISNAETNIGILEMNEHKSAQRLFLQISGWSITLIVITCLLLVWFQLK